MQLYFYIIPQEIINEYNLTDIPHNRKVYIKIQKVIYGLPQAGIIAHDRLKNHLEKHWYQPVKFVPGLWTKTSIPISFTPIFDDFGIKYVEKQHVEHLIQAP